MKTVATRSSVLLLILGGLLLPPATAAQYFPPDDDLRLMLRYLVEDGGATGVVLGVLEPDGTTRIVSHGDPGPGSRPLDPRSVFEIASLTKVFTATLLADMVARGEVQLDDPVSRFLPQHVTVPTYSGTEITLRHLALHTSGLPRGPDNHRPVDEEDPYAGYTLAMGYDFLSGHTLRRRPGQQHEYSNVGYGVLGHALARAAGVPFRELLRERVLDPLGLEMTGFERSGELGGWLTRGHANGRVVSYWSAPEVIEGAGGLLSTAEDVLKFMRASVGPPETELERAMRITHEPMAPGPSSVDQALGWRTMTAPGGGPTVITHSGYSGGFSADVAFMPDRGVGMVTLVNTEAIQPGLATTMTFTPPPPADWPRADVAAHVLARYAGAYRSDTGQELFVRLEDEGFLTYQPRGSIRVKLYATSDSTFYVLRSPWSLTFRFDPEDAGAEVVISQDERSIDPASAPPMILRRVDEATPAPAAVAVSGPAGRASGPVRWLRASVLGALALATLLVLTLRRRVAGKHASATP